MNELAHLEEFQNVLATYQVSDEAQTILHDTKIVLCSAATATGRNTIIRELLKTERYYFIISDTTRRPRTNDGVLEQDGTEYWFRTEDQMLDQLNTGKMVEAEVIHSQQVSGMSVREIEKAHDMNKIAITDADRGGITAIKKVKPDAICLFFLPPSFEEWQRRINDRGDMTDIEKHRRLETAVKEFEAALTNDYYLFVINDDLAEAVAKVDAIATNPQAVDQADQDAGRELAQTILARTRQWLGID